MRTKEGNLSRASAFTTSVEGFNKKDDLNK